MTILAQDSFATGGRGSPNAWSPGSDGGNWTQQRGNQTLSIVSSQGVMTYNGSSTLGVMTYTSLSETIIEVLVNVTPNASGDIIGAVVCFQDSNNFYYADIGNVAGKFEIGKDVAGTFTSLQSATFTWSVSTKYTIRFQYGVATSTTLRAKIWQSSGAEPGSWTVSTTDSSLSTGGKFGVTSAPVGGGTCVFDTFSATNGATGATHFFICDGFGGVFS